MPRQRHGGIMMEGPIMPTKIRKRGCSSSSSSSSRIHRYRLNKRAILVGKNRVGLGIGSRSSTPLPTTPLRSIIDSPKYSQSGKSTQPVSARRLAATLWEMNELPSPKMSHSNLKNDESKMVFKREKMQSGWALHSGSGSCSLPPHLSDPSYSPTISEKMDRSGIVSHERTPSISQRLRSAEQNIGAFDSISNASFMEIETRSRQPTSVSRTRLNDVSSALTTSKELLKIINRIWAHADQPSSTMSVISALHAELERARLQVNHLIQEQCYDKNEVNYLMKCYAEEKASWKNKEQRAIEAAILSIAGELEVERSLRRRLESLNKKLGKELAETKSSFIRAVKELEIEKRAREITEQACDELARNIDEDAEKMKFSEKNSAISKLRKVFLGTKRNKDTNIGSQEDDREVTDSKEDSEESDLHSIELNMNNANKSHKWAYTVGEIKARNSISGWRSTSVQEIEKEAQRKSYYEETERYKPGKGVKDHDILSSRLSLARDCHSPSQPWPSRDPSGVMQEIQSVTQVTRSKSRMADVRGEGQSTRMSKR